MDNQNFNDAVDDMEDIDVEKIIRDNPSENKMKQQIAILELQMQKLVLQNKLIMAAICLYIILKLLIL